MDHSLLTEDDIEGAALEFDDMNIKKHSLNSGQRASKSSNMIVGNSKTCIRPETRGY